MCIRFKITQDVSDTWTLREYVWVKRDNPFINWLKGEKSKCIGVDVFSSLAKAEIHMKERIKKSNPKAEIESFCFNENGKMCLGNGMY